LTHPVNHRKCGLYSYRVKVISRSLVTTWRGGGMCSTDSPLDERTSVVCFCYHKPANLSPRSRAAYPVFRNASYIRICADCPSDNCHERKTTRRRSKVVVGVRPIDAAGLDKRRGQRREFPADTGAGRAR